MAKAQWNGKTIAESDDTIVLEGNHYFPADSVSHAFLVESDTETKCGWKGIANYYHIVVDGDRNSDAAWYYADPKPAADEIRGRVAFWRGVKVEP